MDPDDYRACRGVTVRVWAILLGAVLATWLILVGATAGVLWLVLR